MKIALLLMGLICLLFLIGLFVTPERFKPSRPQTTVETIKSRSSQVSTSSQKIPRVIMQTNERDDIPKGMFTAIETVLCDNPDYDYIYFDAERRRQFIKDHYSEKVVRAYDKLVPGAYRADMFRYCWLYEKGGVYMDSGMVSLRPLGDIIHPDDTFVTPEDDGIAALYNAFIASVPQHPIVGKAIDISVANIEAESYKDGCLGVTGPIVLAKAFSAIVNKKIKPDTNYGNGIRTIKHLKNVDEMKGIVSDGNEEILITKYPDYYDDMKWYTNSARYGDLFDNRMVYKFHTPPKLLEHQERLIRLLEEFDVLTREFGLEYWITDGTLLGAAREKKMIPWDDDIDVQVPSTTVKKLQSLLPLLHSRGYDLTFEDHIWKFRYLSGGYPKLFDEKWNGYIDLFEMKLDDGAWVFVDDYNSERWPRVNLPHNDGFPLKLYSFEGLQVPGPKDADSYLTRLYDDWRIPQKWPTHLNHDG